MRIAFYAPMKPPESPVPSGDRAVARLLIRALEAAGHTVDVASSFRAREPAGEPSRQDRLRRTGARLAGRLVRRYRALPASRRPRTWLTYHVYYKAPDWLGPAVSASLGIPYLIAEASHAPKRAHGKWAIGHYGAEAAIRRADAIIGLNSADTDCLLPLLERPDRLCRIAPFIDTAPFAAAADRRADHQALLAARLGLADGAAILLTVAMMRAGDKLASYRVLARALSRLVEEPWTQVIVGGGPARAEVEAAFADLPRDRVHFLGEVAPADLPALYAATDIYVWPAVREAFGVAIIEAQAAGLPVVAGDAGGVGDVVADGETGLLAAEGDPGAFAEALRLLLQAPYYTAAYAGAARRKASARHGLEAAASAIDRILNQTAAGTAGR